MGTFDIGFGIVFEGVAPKEVTSALAVEETSLVAGCLRGDKLPINKTEADNNFAERSDASDAEAAGINAGGNTITTSEDGLKKDPAEEPNKTAKDHDKEVQDKDKEEKKGCGEGKPSQLVEECFAKIGELCHCDKCKVEPEKKEPKKKKKDDPFSGSYASDITDQEVLDELAAALDQAVVDNNPPQEVHFQSDYGIDLKKVYGTYIIEGNVIHMLPQDTDTQTFKLITGLVIGPTTVVTRVWFGDRIIYNALSSAIEGLFSDMTFELYHGTEAQKITRGGFSEDKGFGRCPAYRDLAILVVGNITLRDIEVLSSADTIPQMTVEVSDSVSAQPQLIYDQTVEYTDDYQFYDSFNSRFYTTTKTTVPWADDLITPNEDGSLKVIDVHGFDPKYFTLDIPHFITETGLVEYPAVGIDIKSRDYNMFQKPITFGHDKYKVGRVVTPFSVSAYTYNPSDTTVHTHIVRNLYACTSTHITVLPPENSTRTFCGFVVFLEQQYSFHIAGDTIYIYGYSSVGEVNSEYTLTLPVSVASASKIFSIAGERKAVFLTENANQVIVLAFSNATKTAADFSIEAAFPYTVQPPLPTFSNQVDSTYFLYISTNYKVVRVDLKNQTVTEETDATLPGAVNNYHYSVGSHSLKFTYDLRLYTYSPASLIPVDVTLKDVYKSIISEYALGEFGLYDYSSMPDIAIGGLELNRDPIQTIITFNQLFGLSLRNDTNLQITAKPAYNLKMATTNNVTYSERVVRTSEASLTYLVIDINNAARYVQDTVTVSASHVMISPTDKRISFTLNMVANGIDFKPLLEAHLVSKNSYEVQLDAPQNTSLIAIGDKTSKGIVTSTFTHPNKALSVTIEPDTTLLLPDTLPTLPPPVNYLFDTITQKESLTPVLLCMPALDTKDRSAALDSQVAYTLVEAPQTSDLADKVREFFLPVGIDISVRADLRPELRFRIWEDRLFGHANWNGRQAGFISKEGEFPILAQKEFTYKSARHPSAAHSGVTVKSPDNIPVNSIGRTSDLDSTMIVKFHHKNTITKLSNATRVDLHDNFLRNLLVVNREYIQYRNFSVDPDGRTVTFTGLHRAQRGTDCFTDCHMVGERVYLYTSDTFKPIVINRLSTLQQAPVDLQIEGAFTKYRTLSDAGSARMLSPLDIRTSYTATDTHLTVNWKARSELFYNMLTEQSTMRPKEIGKLNEDLTQGLYIVFHVLTRPFEVHNFEQELIHGRFNQNTSEPLVWYTEARKVGDPTKDGSIQIKASKLHAVGIYPEVDPVHIVMQFAYPTELYELSALGGEYRPKVALWGYPAYHVMPPVAPKSNAQMKTKVFKAYSVIAP